MCYSFSVDVFAIQRAIEGLMGERFPESDILAMLDRERFFPARGGAGSNIPVLIMEEGKVKLDLYRWDLVPHWWKKTLSEKKFPSYNVRFETVSEKASYRDAWKNNNRCLIPASSFYERQEKKLLPKGEKSEEVSVSMSHEETFCLGGIWSEAVIEGEVVRSCGILTLEANEFMQAIPHSRMPAILHQEDEATWINPNSPENARHCIKPFPSENLVC